MNEAHEPSRLPTFELLPTAGARRLIDEQDRCAPGAAVGARAPDVILGRRVRSTPTMNASSPAMQNMMDGGEDDGWMDAHSPWRKPSRSLEGGRSRRSHTRGGGREEGEPGAACRERSGRAAAREVERRAGRTLGLARNSFP